MLFTRLAFGTLLRQATAAALYARQDASATSISAPTTLSEVPQYFQTTPELFAGPTPTGLEPFLAQTNPAPFASVSYIPPNPVETQQPISGNHEHGDIFEHMGKLSPYFAGPGFGAEEHSLPEGANIVWLNMLHVRHVAQQSLEVQNGEVVLMDFDSGMEQDIRQRPRLLSKQSPTLAVLRTSVTSFRS